jgi:hypothetical protein
MNEIEPGPGPAPVTAPFGGAEIVRELGAVRQWGAAYWGSLAPADFFAPMAGAWSPADHVRHLVKSNRPVARALGLPRLLLLLRFGPALRASRSYSSLRASYQEALRGGVRAGSYAPSPLAAEEHTEAERLATLARWSDGLSALEAATRRWGERGLSRLRLPHPALGLLTVREMLCFTLYHNTHHVLGVAARRQGSAGGSL